MVLHFNMMAPEESTEFVLRKYQDILEEKVDAEGHPTATVFEQEEVEESVLDLFSLGKRPILYKDQHIEYLKRVLSHLSTAFEALDSSRPWFCYWILHSLRLLDVQLKSEDYSKIAQFLGKCQFPTGGFGGGPGQYPHLATTYAAVSSLCIIGTEEAYNVINREGLSKFLKSLHQEDGSFIMHEDGEVDIRGVYCALVVAKLTNICTPEMFKNSEKWIVECQTWEGGFGGCPGMEAHGGYAYCGLASLVLLGATHLFNLHSFLRWLVNKQMRLEGGFQGRTNKLVDGCYSFWQGGSFPLIHAILENEGYNFDKNSWLFDQYALQEYLILCCQHPFGGLLDKPDKPRDVYHTCYTLSGLSVAQHSPQPKIILENYNVLNAIHPVYNLELSCANAALKHFNSLLIPD